jgi:hypothetical protein
MSRFRSDRPAMPAYHPEFGLLCPYPPRRRCIRLVMLSLATTITIGATMGLAIANRTDGEGPASMAWPTDERLVAGVSTAGGAATQAREFCKADQAADLVSFFLGPDCAPNKHHARHGARAANRVATVIIGRTDAAPTATAALSAPVAAPAIVPSEPSTGKADKSANATTAALERTALHKKPKAAKAGAPIELTPAARELSRQNVTRDAAPNAYASAPKFGREAYDPYRDTLRATARQSGVDPRSGWVR